MSVCSSGSSPLAFIWFSLICESFGKYIFFFFVFLKNIGIKTKLQAMATYLQQKCDHQKTFGINLLQKYLLKQTVTTTDMTG